MEDMYTLMLPDIELNSTTTKTTKKSLLLSVPGEIRNKIWRMLLTTAYAFKEPTSEGDREAHYELQPAILRVNRQIYHETRNILREENMWVFFCIGLPKKPVYFVDQTARLPVVSRGAPIDCGHVKDCYLGMNSHALNVFVDPEFNGHRSDNHTMIMGPESLPYLVKLLFPMLYTHRSRLIHPRRMIQMYVGNPICFTRSRLQKEVLEPFLAARGFLWLFVKGNVDETFLSSVRFQMGRPFQHDTELLDFSNDYLEKGDAAANVGLAKAASFYYEQGSDFTFFAGQSYLDNNYRQIEHVYIHDGIASMLTAFDIRWALSLLKLRCYADVQRLAGSVLGRRRLSRATFTDKVYLVLYCAIASLGLGQMDRFSKIMHELFRGRCYLGVLIPTLGPTYSSKTAMVFLRKQSEVPKDAVMKAFDELVWYCNEGEVGGLRRVDTGGALPDRDAIEFPVAQDWSAVPTRYQRRRETWASNLSVRKLC